MSRLELLRDRALVALLASETISVTGSQMTWVALPWFVLTTTHSPGKMTLVLLSESLGLILFGLPGGTLLEKLGPRRTMILADGVRAPLTLVIPVLYWSGALSFALLLVLVFAIGALSTPYFAAQRSIVPELVGEDEVMVGKANVFLQSAQRVTMLLGPATAGVLIALLNAPSVIVIDAATYVVSMVIVAAFVRTRKTAPVEHEQRPGFFDGIRYVVRDPLLRGWMVAFVAGDAAWMAFFAAVPVLVVSDYGSNVRIVGWIFASFGVGAVLGNTVAWRLQERREGLWIIATLVYGQALPLWALVFHIPALAVMGVLFVSGVFNGLVNPSIHALLTLSSPPAIRARVMSALATVFMLSSPLGLAFAGPVLSTAGAHPVLVSFAAIQTGAMALISWLSFRARTARRTAALEAAA
jgi:predicted MFS family arabinose efflux permease